MEDCREENYLCFGQLLPVRDSTWHGYFGRCSACCWSIIEASKQAIQSLILLVMKCSFQQERTFSISVSALSSSQRSFISDCSSKIWQIQPKILLNSARFWQNSARPTKFCFWEQVLPTILPAELAKASCWGSLDKRVHAPVCPAIRQTSLLMIHF